MYCKSMSYSLNPTDSSSCRETSWSGASMDAGSAGGRKRLPSRANGVSIPSHPNHSANTPRASNHSSVVPLPVLAGLADLVSLGGRTEEQPARARTGTRAAPTASNAYVRKVMYLHLLLTAKAPASNRELESTHAPRRAEIHSQSAAQESKIGECERRDSDKQAGDNGVDGIRNEAENRDYKTEQVVGSIGEDQHACLGVCEPKLGAFLRSSGVCSEEEK
ncbi:hypothetical protein B0H14DRAFT_2612593 [Mycena olivaceomarginata]|nr:hypothetical protein B0H14DRAFT_2612593 [Mycena olivaceomarginata]